MTKKNNNNLSIGELLEKLIFPVYTLVIIGCLTAGVLVINNAAPQKVAQTTETTSPTVNARVFDQTTVNTVNGLNGSATNLPSGRINPF